MAELLSGKSAVVTGGASGIGRAISVTFAEHGAHVTVADVTDEPRGGGRPTHVLIDEETGGGATYVECDVTDVSDLASVFEAAEEFGGVDVLVNNAGILGDESFPETTEETYQRIMDINVKGSYFGSQIATHHMQRTGGGSIINVSSELGIHGSGEHVIYSMSKGALRLLTYSLAAAVGPDIRVNAIHPGTIRTQLNVEDISLLDTETGAELKQSLPLRRFGEATEVATAALFFASDLSSYVTAASLPVDGGSVNTG